MCLKPPWISSELQPPITKHTFAARARGGLLRTHFPCLNGWCFLDWNSGKRKRGRISCVSLCTSLMRGNARVCPWKLHLSDANSYSAEIVVSLHGIATVTWGGEWCPPFSFGGGGEDLGLENWEGWGNLFDPAGPFASTDEGTALNSGGMSY